jgi:heat shock protein HslJ
MSYNVRAEIRDRGRRMFTTDTAYPVLTRGNGDSVDMVLISMSSNPIRKPDASLTETYWKLIAIREAPYTPSENQREAHLKLRGFNNAVEGSGGCNSFAGTYTLEDEKLTLGPLAMTAMACIDGMDTEREFAQALSELNRYEIEGDTLRAHKDEELILRFEAIYLP